MLVREVPPVETGHMGFPWRTLSVEVPHPGREGGVRLSVQATSSRRSSFHAEAHTERCLSHFTVSEIHEGTGPYAKVQMKKQSCSFRDL